MVAIAAVVLVHVVAPAVTGETVREGTAAWWGANVLDAASRWCVPVFIMVSGALLLDPRRVERPRDFYRRRLGRIGIPLVVWTIIYLAFRHWVLPERLTPEGVQRDVLAGTPFLQLYFLFVIAGLYVLSPFLKIIIRFSTRRMQLGFVAVLLGLGAVDELANTIFGVGGANAATRFVPFTGYYVAGWVLRDIVMTRARIRLAALAFVLSVALTAIATGVVTLPEGWGAGGRYIYGFLSPTVMVMSLSGYLLLRAVGLRFVGVPGGLVTRLSSLTFGVFLVHPLLLYPLQRAWPLVSESVLYLAGALAHWGLTVTGSLVLTVVLLRLPVLRRVV